MAVTGITVAAIYLVLLPFVDRTWRTTGDEPHYLLAAHSIVHDGDFDLTDNYLNFDYLNFYFSKDIVPQVRFNAAGQQILNHYPALSLLVAPAYLLGGRSGVLIMQAIMGGVLAAMMYRLAELTSRDTLAALLATGLVAFSLPVVAYPYLIYPEWIGAVLVTLVVFVLVTHESPGMIAVGAVLIALTLLPWLNRRFIPLALVSAVAVVWYWRGQRNLLINGVLTLAMTAISIGGIIWFNSQLSVPARADITAPVAGLDIWFRLVRGIGWLMDQQRGLLVFAPIYAAALWGVPAFIRYTWPARIRYWLVLLPLGLSLGIVFLAGGFWIAWELGPRFLVVGLPGVTVLLALAWRDLSRNFIGVALLVLLALVSLFNSWVVINNPELPYKSSLPIYYSEKLSVPFTEVLPDMAGYGRIVPDPDKRGLAPVVTVADQPVWSAPAGRSQQLVNGDSLTELPYGHYLLRWRLQAPPELPPDTALARLSVKQLGGGQLLEHRVTAADLPVNGNGVVTIDVLNPNPDRWRTPMVLHASATGAVDLLAGDLLFTPNQFFAVWLPYLYLALWIATMLLVWWLVPSQPGRRWPAPGRWGGVWSVVIVVGVCGYLFYQLTSPIHHYNATELAHFVGRPVIDRQAGDGEVWYVDPAVDMPQKAVYGPFDFFDPGVYHVTFRIKLSESVDPQQMVARLQVNATANYDELVTQPILAEHFSRPGLYHDMVVTFQNPRRQALSFEVHYLGTAPLYIDTVTVADGTP
jgi:hypothetical protein